MKKELLLGNYFLQNSPVKDLTAHGRRICFAGVCLPAVTECIKSCPSESTSLLILEEDDTSRKDFPVSKTVRNFSTELGIGR